MRDSEFKYLIDHYRHKLRLCKTYSHPWVNVEKLNPNQKMRAQVCKRCRSWRVIPVED